MNFSWYLEHLMFNETLKQLEIIIKTKKTHGEIKESEHKACPIDQHRYYYDSHNKASKVC